MVPPIPPLSGLAKKTAVLENGGIHIIYVSKKKHIWDLKISGSIGGRTVHGNLRSGQLTSTSARSNNDQNRVRLLATILVNPDTFSSSESGGDFSTAYLKVNGMSF